MFYVASKENLVVASPLQVTYEKKVEKDETGAITSDKVIFTRRAAKTYRFVAMSAEAAVAAKKLAVAKYTRSRYDVEEIRVDGSVIDYRSFIGHALQAEIVRVRNSNNSWDLKIAVREIDRHYDLATKSPEDVFTTENRRDYDEDFESDVITISALAYRQGYIIRENHKGSGYVVIQVKLTPTQLEWENAGKYMSGVYYDLPAGAVVRALYGLYTSNSIILPERPA